MGWNNPLKYKFVETLGCTAFGFTINEQSLEDVSKEAQKEIVDYLCLRMKEGLDDGTILFSDIVKVFQPSDWKYDNSQCDTCGDTVSWEVWEL